MDTKYIINLTSGTGEREAFKIHPRGGWVHWSRHNIYYFAIMEYNNIISYCIVYRIDSAYKVASWCVRCDHSTCSANHPQYIHTIYVVSL